MAVLFVAMIVGSVSALVGFALFLIFCAFVVVRTGGTAGLRDVAVAVRAFASVWSLGSRNRLKSIGSTITSEVGELQPGQRSGYGDGGPVSAEPGSQVAPAGDDEAA
jgi:hypothetical protein